MQARHTSTSVLAAIKLLATNGDMGPTARRRFLREAKALRAVTHPHLAKVRDVLEDNEPPCIVLEYLDGPTLAGAALARGDALEILAQVAEALDAMHVAGLVHRDVKPENVVLVAPPPKPDARLIDLGLVRCVDGKLDSMRTATGVLVGSLAYAAPEVIFGTPAGPASDIWSLGVMGYELLSGGLPFQAPSKAELAAAIVNTPAPRLEGTGALSDLFAAMLDEEPEQRPRRAIEVAAALRGVSATGFLATGW